MVTTAQSLAASRLMPQMLTCQHVTIQFNEPDSKVKRSQKYDRNATSRVTRFLRLGSGSSAGSARLPTSKRHLTDPVGSCYCKSAGSCLLSMRPLRGAIQNRLRAPRGIGSPCRRSHWVSGPTRLLYGRRMAMDDTVTPTRGLLKGME